MASLEAFVQEKVELEARRDAALASLARRSGVPVPPLWGTVPKPLTSAPWVLDLLALTVFALEQCEQLATEIDALRMGGQPRKVMR
jgi:hypothetical protein